MAEFRMPSLGADMVAGTLVEWRVGPGATVQRGDIVAEVETDKGAVEVEIFEAGVVEALLVEPGTRVPVGTPLARLRPTEGVAIEAAPPARPSPATRKRASPLARKRAEALGVDLAAVAGTGAGGVVTVADVEGAASKSPTRPEAGREEPMRRAIAAAMSRSKREVPHYYLTNDVDASPLLNWLAARNAGVPVARRMLPITPLIKVVALALREVPGFNGHYRDGRYHPSEAIHVGMAIRLRGGGLAAPAIHDADRLPLEELAAAMHDLIERMRSGAVRSSELADPTVTVTSLGDQGVDQVIGVVFAPQVAIIGLGRIRERPWARAGMVGAHPVLGTTLSADHRVSDGYQGARLLSVIEHLIQEPERL